MADLEDGEVLDSDEETPSVTNDSQSVFPGKQEDKPGEKTPVWSLQHRVSVDEASRSSYRSSTPHEVDSDSDSLESDEDSELWKSKQAKYFRVKQSKSVENTNNRPPALEKKRNNIWGSVIQEQDLTATLHSVDVDSTDIKHSSNRSVESYDYRNKYRDTRPDLDESKIPQVASNDPFDQVLQANTGRSIIDYEDTVDNDRKQKRRNRKRKYDSMDVQESNLSGRLGKKQLTTRLGAVKVNKDNTKEEVVEAIVDILNEPNMEMIKRVVESLGKEFALRILQQTRDVEEAGGMMVNNGSRRRTPGGVYIQIMKADKECTSTHKKFIFADNDFYSSSKNKKRSRKKKKGLSSVNQATRKESSVDCMEEDLGGNSGVLDGLFREEEGEEDGPLDFAKELEETKIQILASKLNSQNKPDAENVLNESHVCRNPENGEEMLVKGRLEAESYDGMADIDQEEANVVDVPIGDS